MLKLKTFKIALVSLFVLAAGTYLVSYTIKSRAQQIRPPAIDNAQANRARVKSFSELSPQVEEFKGKLLDRPSRAGNIVLFVRFAREERVPQKIEVRLDPNTVIFHDDGRDGDEKANDGIHSAITTLNLRDLEVDQRRISSLRSDAVPVFRGRELVNIRRLDKKFNINRLKPGLVFDLLPVGDPANIIVERSLMINDPGVVQDPGRTRTTCAGSSTGKWSFGYLMQQMSNSIPPEEFTRRWLRRWKTDQIVNDFTVPDRMPNIDTIINNWPKLADNVTLDLSKAPFRLLAIVNRLDLRGSFSYGGGGANNGGELRFVFGYVDPASSCAARPFTVIFEYGVKIANCIDMKAWAQQWKNLEAMVPGTVAYNNALELITEKIVKANAGGAKPNGSAINQIRTNERFIGVPWELREFNIFSTPGHLEEATVKQSPDNSFRLNPGTVTLSAFVNQFESDVLMDRHTVPLVIGVNADPFLGAASEVPGDNVGFKWPMASITNPDARHHFSLQTCNSCHAGETQTQFTHIDPAGFGNTTANLSRFLRGNTPNVNDNEFFSVPDGAANRQFNDLRRRATDMDALLNAPCFKLFAVKNLKMVH